MVSATVFKTKAQAMKFAKKRIVGFRKLLKEKGITKSRKVMLRRAIKSVKIKRIKRKHWKTAIYEVIGY